MKCIQRLSKAERTLSERWYHILPSSEGTCIGGNLSEYDYDVFPRWYEKVSKNTKWPLESSVVLTKKENGKKKSFVGLLQIFY